VIPREAIAQLFGSTQPFTPDMTTDGVVCTADATATGDGELRATARAGLVVTLCFLAGDFFFGAEVLFNVGLGTFVVARVARVERIVIVRIFGAVVGSLSALIETS
jgi:hypothetical protein